MQKSKFFPVCVIVSFLILSAMATPSEAGFKKWFKKEVLGAVLGKRLPRIHEYVRIHHDGKDIFKLAPMKDTAMLSIGGVTIKTHQLRKRLAQVGCTIATKGDVLNCARDIVERELGRLIAQAELKRNKRSRPEQRFWLTNDTGQDIDFFMHYEGAASETQEKETIPNSHSMLVQCVYCERDRRKAIFTLWSKGKKKYSVTIDPKKHYRIIKSQKQCSKLIEGSKKWNICLKPEA